MRKGAQIISTRASTLGGLQVDLGDPHLVKRQELGALAWHAQDLVTCAGCLCGFQKCTSVRYSAAVSRFEVVGSLA